MKEVTQTKKILIACIILNVCIFGMYGFLYFSIKKNNEQISILQSEAEKDTQKDSSLRAIKASLDNNKEFISQIDSHFVPRDGVVDFIDTLEKFGKESGVVLSIGSVSAEESKIKNDFRDSLHLHVDTIGSWKDIFYFLSILESLPYRIQFDQVSFILSGATDSILFNASSTSATRRRSSNEFWKGSFDITVYKLH